MIGPRAWSWAGTGTWHLCIPAARAAGLAQVSAQVLAVARAKGRMNRESCHATHFRDGQADEKFQTSPTWGQGPRLSASKLQTFVQPELVKIAANFAWRRHAQNSTVRTKEANCSQTSGSTQYVADRWPAGSPSLPLQRSSSAIWFLRLLCRGSLGGGEDYGSPARAKTLF